MNDIYRCLNMTAADRGMKDFDIDFTITMRPKETTTDEMVHEVKIEEAMVEKKKKYEMKTTRVRLGDYGNVLDFKYNPQWKNDTVKKKVMNYLFERFTTNDEYKSHVMYFRLTKRSLYVHGDLMFQRLESIVGSEQLLDVIIVKH